MNLKKLTFILSFLLLAALMFTSAHAEGDEKNKPNQQLNKVLGTPVRTYLNINNISTVIKNDGISDIDVQEANSGFVFPKGSGKTAVFTSGFLWGAKIDGDPQVRVGGTAYRTGLQPGRITNSGLPYTQLTAEDGAADHVRIYRVRPDVYPGGPVVDLSQDASLEQSSASAIRTQYELDWTNWPAQFGAPYDDKNSNGTYEATIDVPGVPGADQTIWFVANDLNVSRTQNLYGALPLGVEMQATFWAYAQSGALGNMFFRKYKLINKSNTPFNEMYVSMWSDVDLGNSGDDFTGCDVDLSLSFTYNANATDPTYSPLPPPAVGFDFFQGPEVNGVPLPMTAHYYFARGDPNITDPTQGSLEGSNQFYNFFQGKIGKTGEVFIDPTTGQPTTFALSGDPIAKTGWLDGQLLPSGDRRQGMASGPFTMMPGDEQEIVVAEIAAGAIPGVDRISAVGLLKFYDQVAQVAYDSDFDLPVPPPSTSVKVIELDRKIVLDWGTNTAAVTATENSNSKGYDFEGYNVYQLPSASASVSEGKKIATFDVINGVGKINDLVFDISTGSVVSQPVQFGNDTGIKRYLEITSDEFKQAPLINGIRYYFAVTAYNYNSTPGVVPNNLETPLRIFTIVPQSAAPGFSLGEPQGSALTISHVGSADGGPTVKVVDPTALTGHDYEVFFTDRQEVRNTSGDWIPAATIASKNTNPNSPDDLTGTTIDVAAVAGIGEIELRFKLNLVSPNGAWADGLTITIPAGITILSAPTFDAGGGTVVPEIVGNTINFGLIDLSYTQNGVFHGDEEWIVKIGVFTPPAAIAWEVFDDGWENLPVHATGTTTVTEIGLLSRLAKYWNLRDVTSNTVKLSNQSVIDGVDLFPKSFNTPTQLGADAAPIVDGMQIGLKIGYNAPVTMGRVDLNGTALTASGGPPGAPGTQWINDDWDITDYTIFGFLTGTSNEKNGYGSLSIDDLQQDYEFRWNGVKGDTVINGQTIQVTKSGGSMATFYGARGYGMGLHPLNPTAGSTTPFLVRIPFEVWNKDQNIQVNYQIYDRGQTNPAAQGFKVWNDLARMYCEVSNTPYNATATLDPTAVGDSYTWMHVFYASSWTTNDIIDIYYDNPVQVGVDKYTFKANAGGYSADLAKSELDKINVFPNPYYGVNSEELNKYNRFVTFSHLPAKATIRIFNLAGVLVKKIEKDDAGQFQRWDLANDSGLPVSSGLYIAYLELPELGETKILKIAVIQEQQILDRF